MKTGIELIMEERSEQINKHGRTIPLDVEHNHGEYEIDGDKFHMPQLIHAASQLISLDDSPIRENYLSGIFTPHGWDEGIWLKMIAKPYKDRLVIAGALIAAEIDRLQAIEMLENKIE